jgi:hypothetical protein
LEEVKVNVFAPVVKVEAAAPVRLSAPEEFTVTTPVPEPIFEVPEEVREVKVPAPAVPPPIAPGAAKVAPLRDDAFRLATFVVDATENGAVPVGNVDVICPENEGLVTVAKVTDPVPLFVVVRFVPAARVNVPP